MSAFRYKAFISYAHRDASAVAWLHRRLEGYRAPRPKGSDAAPERLRPVFRDREELPASGNLGNLLTAALEESEYLIVVCSPASAQSHWVGEEIRHFRRTRGADKILAFIVDGEPHSGGEDECFPAALLEPGEDGAPVEPIAADGRPEKDGKRLAFLKLAAGLLNRDLDALVQRDAARRNRRLAMVASASTVGMVGALALTFYADTQRREAVEQRQIAQTNERTAEATRDYLVNTFGIANPGTENPKEITVLTVLERGKEGIVELEGEPDVQAQLYSAVGEIYKNLGFFETALDTYNDALALLEPGSREVVQLTLDKATLLARQGLGDEALALLDAQEEAIESLGDTALVERAEAQLIRAKIYKDAVDLPNAISAYRAAQQSLAAAPGDHKRRLVLISDQLAVTYQMSDRTDLAAQEYAKALDLRREYLPPDHQSIGTALNNLAYFHFNSGNLDDAERLSREAIALKQRVFDLGNPQLADTQMMFGQVLEAREQLDAAWEQFSEAREGLLMAYPNGHFKLGYVSVHLGSVAGKMGETDEALTLLDQAEGYYDGSYGRLHPNHGDLEVYRADVLVRAGRMDEARAACAKARDILVETLGADSPGTIALMDRCAQMGAL
ncbi:MAG: toll/interleukin-1 receptor domain-containing protein [Pseudomonadota bacterium]